MLLFVSATSVDCFCVCLAPTFVNGVVIGSKIVDEDGASVTVADLIRVFAVIIGVAAVVCITVRNVGGVVLLSGIVNRVLSAVLLVFVGVC